MHDEARESLFGYLPRAMASEETRRRRPRPTGPMVRKLGEDRGLRLTDPAIRSIRSGHPWVFRDSIVRHLDGLHTGGLVPLMDEGGKMIAQALYEAEGGVAARVVSRHPAEKWSPSRVEQRLGEALAHREALGLRQGGGAFRVVHGEADGLPGFSVDAYADFLLLYRYSDVARSFEETATQWLVAALKPKGVYVQDRTKPVTADAPREPAQHVFGERVPTTGCEVTEDGLKVVVDVSAPVSPGLFIDLREGRRLAEPLCAGRKVLNLFSYTGTFGLRAARAGAAEVVQVDAAAKAHARARSNFAASGFDSELGECHTSDVFKFLERARQRGRTFDVIVADPPPFSRVKDRMFSALRDWSELMEAMARVAAPGADVLAICNAVRLPEDDFLSALGYGLVKAERRANVIEERGLPPDFPTLPGFPEGNYLKIKRLRMRD